MSYNMARPNHPNPCPGCGIGMTEEEFYAHDCPKVDPYDEPPPKTTEPEKNVDKVHRCKTCGSAKIQQQVTLWVYPDDIERELEWSSGIWEDKFWCCDCEAEVDIKKVNP